MTDQPSPPEASPPPRVVVPRWIQLVALPLGLLGAWTLLTAAGEVLFIFLVAGVLALILNPIVALLQRRLRLPRGLAIATTFLGLLVTVLIAGFLLANPIADQAQRFADDVPGIIDQANERLASLQETFDEQGIDVEVKRQGETALQTLQSNVVGGTEDVAQFGAELLRTLVETGFALVLTLVVTIYMLVYAPRIGELARSVLPPGDGTKEDDFPTRVQRAVGGYVRGQAMFSLLMGTGAAIGLYVYGVLGIFPEGRTYALAFGIFFGLMEVVPFIGPFIGGLPPVLVALFQDPLTAVWVTLLFVALQQVEGHVVAPMVFSRALHLNPLLVLFALLFGGHIYGIVGALLALPMAACAREVVLYLRRHLVLEPWATTTPFALAGPAPPPPERDDGHCPACGRPVAPEDAFCRGCGSELGSPRISSSR